MKNRNHHLSVALLLCVFLCCQQLRGAPQEKKEEDGLPRDHPLSPEESLAAWHIDGDFELQIAAAEPIVTDPVDVVWDAQGRMFVAEMRDYPLPKEGEQLLSRIRLLSDTDGDGRMDKAVTWADKLDHVQGLLPINGGLLATTRTAILFLKDSDGDDVADEIRPLFQNNAPMHSQLQVSSPRWGLDNAIYINNGIHGREIYPEGKPGGKIFFSKLNLRFDPYSGKMSAVPGVGQFGAAQDDWGHHFYCDNHSPVMFTVFSLEVMKRNPFAGISEAYDHIQEQWAPVWPINVTHTSAYAHAGTHTAACGMGVYRGGLMPELRDTIFVCEPTAQLVTRNFLKQKGASLKAKRIGDQRDFLVSSDEWTRPVNIRNGPDGALYICDFYRRFVEHSRFFPEEFSQSHNMRTGTDRGRIWRLVPKGKNAAKIESLPNKSSELVRTLQHKNAWQRIHAQRVLMERQDDSVVSDLAKMASQSESPQARLHALWTLNGLKALTASQISTALKDNEPRVIENAIHLAILNGVDLKDQFLSLTEHKSRRVRMMTSALALANDQRAEVSSAFTKMLLADPDDLWLRRGIISASEKRCGSILASLLSNKDYIDKASDGKINAIIDLARSVGARGDNAEIAKVLTALRGKPDWWQFAFVSGFGEGLLHSKLPTKTVTDLIAKPPKDFSEKMTGLKAVLDSAEQIVLDKNEEVAARIAALPLVQQLSLEKNLAIVEQLIHPTEPQTIQQAACQALARFDRNKVTDFFFTRWKSLAPTPQREALALIAGNPKTGFRLMQKMKSGDINKALMPPLQRWDFGRSKDPAMKELAEELFGKGDADRAKVIAEYQAALSKFTGDAKKGLVVFQRAACVTCHKLGEHGIQVGPNISDVKIRQPESLLSDILDPNRLVDQQWTTYLVETKSGQAMVGIIAAEATDSVTLKMPGGLTQTVSRNDITKMEATGISLMPLGLEAAISKEDMVHLIAFLKAK